MSIASHALTPVKSSLLTEFETLLKSEAGIIALALVAAFGSALFAVRLCRIMGRW